MPGKECYYAALGVANTATEKEIRNAFTARALKKHPDKVLKPDSTLEERKEAQRKFIELKEAFELLSDPVRRNQYDEDLFKDNSVTENKHLEIEAEGLERPSARFNRLNMGLEEAYRQNPLKRIIPAERQKVLDTAIPLNNLHFSPLYYQHLYTLNETTPDGTERDETFADVYALIAKKALCFSDSEVACPFLGSPLTPEIAGEILCRFLKGHYFGPTLLRIQDYLRLGSVSEKKIPSLKLYQAILQLISIEDLALSYESALQAIHQLYDAAHLRFQAIDLDCKRINLQQTLLEIEYQTALLETKTAKEHWTKLLTNRNQLQHSLNVWEKILNGETYEREACLLGHQEDSDQIASIDLQLPHAKQRYDWSTQQSDELHSRIVTLKEYKDTLEAQKISNSFLDIIDNHYFKLTLATCISHYWHDEKPVVTPERFAQTIANIITMAPERVKTKYSAVGVVLWHADQHLVAMAHQHDLTAQHYAEHAAFFYDLANSGMMTMDAYSAAGLCWQLAARHTDTETEAMVFEHLALNMYQAALRLAFKMPPAAALYATVHVAKYLTELQFNNNTLSKSDLEKIVAQLQSRHETIPPPQYARLTVHSGSVLNSLHGAMDRAFYLMTCFPTYSAHTPLIDQNARRLSYRNLMEGLLNRTAARLEDSSTTMTWNVSWVELIYYRYEQALLSDDCPEEKLHALRLQSMHLLLEQSNTSFHELNRLMSTPYTAMPQDTNGWWRAGPLNYPPDPKTFGLVTYKSFDGYMINEKTGDIEFFFTPWNAGDDPNDQLFTHDDFLDLLQRGIDKATFSLDANSDYRQFDPLQKVRISPKSIQGTSYAGALFDIDYIMKEVSQAVEINGTAPFATRAIRLLDGLDESVKADLLTCATSIDQTTTTSQATRFWIELSAIPLLDTQKAYRQFFSLGDPKVVVKKQLLRLGTHGQLEDEPLDSDDTSAQAQFASAFTKHYPHIRQQLPVFRQAEQFYKITAAVNSLQEKRVINQKIIALCEDRLNSTDYWEKEAAEKRQEWTGHLNNPSYWIEYFQERKKYYTALLQNDAYWEQQVEDLVADLKHKKEAVETQQGELYQSLNATMSEEYQTLFSKLYDADPKLAWTIDTPKFKEHSAQYQDALRTLSLAGLANSLNDMTKEEMFAQHRKALKESIMKQLGLFKFSTGIMPYQAAQKQWMQGKLSPMAAVLACHHLAQQVERNAFSPAIERCYRAIKQDMYRAKRHTYQQLRDGDRVQYKKALYTETDPEFTTFYATTRAQIRQNHIEQYKSTTLNWEQELPGYLATIDSILDREFSQQSQLKAFNQDAAKSRADIKQKYQSMFGDFFTDETSCAIAIEEFIHGEIDSIVEAALRKDMVTIKDALRHNKPLNSPELQSARDRLLDIEQINQTVAMQQEWANINRLPVAERRCPDYEFLMTYFAQLPFEQAVDSFMNRDFKPFITSRVASDFEDLRKELATELQPKAQAIVDEQKNDLRNNLVAKAESDTEHFKDALTNHMDEQIELYVNHAKKSLQDQIDNCTRQEAGFMHIELGESENETPSVDTSLRVPAIFSRRNPFSVYGGVSAKPSYQQVDKTVSELEKATFGLRTVFGLDPSSQIRYAKETLREVPLDLMHNASVRSAMSYLEEIIRRAEYERRSSTFTHPTTWFTNPTDFVHEHVREKTFNAFSSEAPSARHNMHAWRFAQQSAPTVNPNPAKVIIIEEVAFAKDRTTAEETHPSTTSRSAGMFHGGGSDDGGSSGGSSDDEEDINIPDIDNQEEDENSPFAPGSIGAAKPWTTNARLTEARLPAQGKAHFIPPEGYNPKNPLPRGKRQGFMDQDGNEWVKGDSRTPGEPFEWDVQLSQVGLNYFRKMEAAISKMKGKDISFVKQGEGTFGGNYVNISLKGRVTH